MSILLRDNIRTQNDRLKQTKRRRLRQVLLLAFAGIVTAITVHLWAPLGTSPSGDDLSRIEKSPNFKDGAFVNALPIVNASFWDLNKAYIANEATGLSPKTPIPLAKPVFSEPAPQGLRVTWLGHSSFIVAIDGIRVLIDPVFGPTASPSTIIGPKRFHKPPLTVAELPKIDAIAISHDHYDHLDYPTVKALLKLDVPYFTPLGVGAHLAYWGVPKKNITELDWWQSATLKGVKLVATPSRHASGRGLLDQNKTQWSGWAMIGPQHRAYYSGDTGMFKGFRQIGERLGPFDITMIESGAYSSLWPDWHLGPEQAMQAHLDVQGKVMLPVHWGTFNLALHNWTEPVERIRAGAGKLGIRFIAPRPGATVDVAKIIEQGQEKGQEQQGQALAEQSKPWWEALPWRTAKDNPVVSSGMAGFHKPAANPPAQSLTDE